MLFYFDHVSYDASKAYLVPRGIESKKVLLGTLCNALAFPFFGYNWDALNDCLRDLSWLEEETIVLLHEDLPLSSRSMSEAEMYLSILMKAIKWWRYRDEKRLRVGFPISDKEKIENILSDILKERPDLEPPPIA